MPALAAAISPGSLFQTVLSIEPGLRTQYLRLESVPQASTDVPPAVLIKNTAYFLELILVGAFVHEALAELGCSSIAEITPEIAAEARSRTTAMYGRDPVAVLDEVHRHLEIDLLKKPEFQLSLEAVVRSMKSALEICPIEHLEQLAAAGRLEKWGHRCRIAYDGIKAFVLRNAASQRAQVLVVGQAFVRGSLSVSDVATLLEVHPVDAVALLESHGFRRPLEQVSLEASKRSKALAEMRADRIARAGEPAWTHESIARDVVASERLEGVDARRWIVREGQ